MATRNLVELVKSGTSIFRRPADLFAAFTSGMNSLGTFWVFCLMFLICADIISRTFLNFSIRGVSEIVGYSIVTAVFLQFANTLHVGRFTRAEVLIDWLEKKRPVAGFSFMAAFHLLGFGVFAMITYGTFPKLVTAWRTNEVTGVPGDFTFIIWPFLAIIVAGAAATALEFAIQLVGAVGRVAQALRARRPGDAAA